MSHRPPITQPNRRLNSIHTREFPPMTAPQRTRLIAIASFAAGAVLARLTERWLGY